ncbi:hypothetical protein FOCG_01265 [Fusarium oxysporum f. sp. radicis-lycopersici 26381]|nr:hypothetical protein FOCG_01265 [Fusarium oxysporum f. sp. radicis-lycopersici 26381]
MEDCETLNNAPKEQVHDQFSQWVSERSTERDGARADDPLAVYLQDIDIVSMLIRNASTPSTNTLPGSRQALKVTKGLSFVSCWMRNVNQEDEAETDFPLPKDAPRNTQAGFTLA